MASLEPALLGARVERGASRPAQRLQPCSASTGRCFCLEERKAKQELQGVSLWNPEFGSQSAGFSAYSPLHPPVRPSSIHTSICPSACPSIQPSACLFIHLSIHPPIHPAILLHDKSYPRPQGTRKELGKNSTLKELPVHTRSRKIPLGHMNRMSERQQGAQRMESKVTRKIVQKTWNQDLEDEQEF